MQFALLVLIAVFASVQVRAQTIVINPPLGAGASRMVGKGQRITVNITLSTPIPAATMPNEWTAELTDANQSLYKVVSAECAVLNAVFKGDCKLVQIATNGNINDRNNYGNPQADGSKTITVSANATFDLEPSAPPPAR